MNNDQHLTPDQIKHLTTCTDPWLSCDDCFDLIHIVIEGLLGAAKPLSPGFRAHLNGCAVCYDEATSLASLIAPEYNLGPQEATRRLDAAIQAA